MRKVAVLGGGMAGLTAAWALSGPESKGRYEVTVYQRGWRLGGKGASSRGVDGRIEEHGLHVWLGYYDNAFRLMRQVYDELDRPTADPSCVIPGFAQAFSPVDRVGLEDHWDGRWSHWLATFSANDGQPGIGRPGESTLMSVGTFARRALGLLVDFASSLPAPVAAHRSGVTLSGSPDPPTPSATPADRVLWHAEVGVLIAALEAVRAVGRAGTQVGMPGGFIVERLTILQRDIATRIRGNDGARRSGELADLVSTSLRGIVTDQLLTDPRGFAAIDHLDLRDWLRRHGALPQTCDSALVRGLYDLAFAYEGGNPGQPRFAAGTGLFLAGKMFFDYQGAIFWHMNAGMGDVVFAPLYQALQARGVQFEFFHRIERLQVGKNGKRIKGVTLGRQARVRNGVEYQPLIRVNGLPCFPAEPLAAQLIDGPGEDSDKHWSNRTVEQQRRLKAGVDFDDIVLAVSVGMIPHICPEILARSARWRRMVSSIGTVSTQSLQLWLTGTEHELGWPQPGAAVSGYVAPFDTYASMSHLIPKEDWPTEATPRSIAYFCSALADEAAADPRLATKAVRSNALELLTGRIGHFWPAAIAADGEFRWDVLHAAPEKIRESRLDAQFWQANIDPSDRYVQSLPGSSVHRLRPDESGYRNLFLAGDWVNSGINAGCIEAAALSGLQAANAVRGRPLGENVFGAGNGLSA
jgi:uncharacterized protein with NAD-binding domain and iron-sulfur cluster